LFGDTTKDIETKPHRGRNETDTHVDNDNETEVKGVNPDLLGQRQEQGKGEENRRCRLHQAAHDEIEDVDQEEEQIGVSRNLEDEVCDPLCHKVRGEDPTDDPRRSGPTSIQPKMNP